MKFCPGNLSFRLRETYQVFMAQLKVHETRSSPLCFDSHLPLFKTLYADIVLKSQTLHQDDQDVKGVMSKLST